MPRRKADAAFARDLGKRLRAFRMRAGVSSTRLADLAGVSRALITEIEKGNTIPSLPTLFAFADVLRFNVDALRRPTDEGLGADLVTIASWRARAEKAEAALEEIRGILNNPVRDNIAAKAHLNP